VYSKRRLKRPKPQSPEAAEYSRPTKNVAIPALTRALPQKFRLDIFSSSEPILRETSLLASTEDYVSPIMLKTDAVLPSKVVIQEQALLARGKSGFLFQATKK
jgi:hypothetical protein